MAKGDSLSPSEAEVYDGTSFASWLTRSNRSAQSWPRDAVLIEYQSIKGGPSRDPFACDGDMAGSANEWECLSAFGEAGSGWGGSPDRHDFDSVNNSFSALRWVRPFGGAGTLLYAEFTDVDNAAAWDFAPSEINFYELYNMTADPFALDNIYSRADEDLLKALRDKLHAAIRCRGTSECEAAMVV